MRVHLVISYFIHQVLRVYPNSPGSRAGLKAYFDFIVAIGNTRFNKENGSLREILKASVDQKLKMIVYNTRAKKSREVEIIPSTSWGGNGLLGVSIKHSSFDRADERVWHVIEVEPGSPAQAAGFKAKEDYVIGSDSILQENDDLYNLIEAHEGKALKLFVYNVNSDNCREVVCQPNSKWGGKGYLGCEFGHGLLHRIPHDDAGELNEGLKAPLLRNDHLLHQQVRQLQSPSQPGQQLFQKVLSESEQQQRQQQTPNETQAPRMATSQLPQTFAQLASAQYQNFEPSPRPTPPPAWEPVSMAPKEPVGVAPREPAREQALTQTQVQDTWQPPIQPMQIQNQDNWQPPMQPMQAQVQDTWQSPGQGPFQPSNQGSFQSPSQSSFQPPSQSPFQPPSQSPFQPPNQSSFQPQDPAQHYPNSAAGDRWQHPSQFQQ